MKSHHAFDQHKITNKKSITIKAAHDKRLSGYSGMSQLGWGGHIIRGVTIQSPRTVLPPADVDYRP